MAARKSPKRSTARRPARARKTAVARASRARRPARPARARARAKAATRTKAKAQAKSKLRRKSVKAPKRLAPKKAAAARRSPARPAPRAARKPPVAPTTSRARLNRERRRLPEAERADPARIENDPKMMSSARAGHDELQANLARHTESSPALTAGDVDAKWEDAYAVGDEAPGGDNPTPDQDRVDDIGRALGVTYNEAEELKGSDKITDRDKHRWELDPASSDDWPHER